MKKKIDIEKMFAVIYRSLYVYKSVAESMDRELNRQGFVAIDTPNGVRFEEIKPLQFNLSQLKRVAKKVTKDKESATKFLKSAGIIDSNGKLSREYR